MSGRRRSFTPEYRVEAAHQVVHDERRRMAAASGGAESDSGGGQPLSPDERAELVQLRAKVTEQAKGIAFLEKASAYAWPTRRIAANGTSVKATISTSPMVGRYFYQSNGWTMEFQR